MPAGNLGFGTGDAITGGVRSALAGGSSVDTGAGVYLLDTFTAPNDTIITAHTPDLNPAGHSYVKDSGTWTIQGNSLQPDPGEDGAACRIDIGKALVTMDADFVYQDNNFPGLIVRALDANNYHLVQLRLGNMELYSNVAGSFTQLATLPVTPVAGQSYHLTVTAHGTTLTATLRFQGTVSATMAANLTATGVGFRQGNGGAGGDPISFGNVVVTSP